MTSGVTCTQDCIDVFNELKLRKTHRYIIYGLVNSDRQIGILKLAPRSATYDEFVQDLVMASNEGQGRYAVYDMEMQDRTPCLVFVVWTPENINVRYRMLYASSKDALKRKLIGIKRELEANDLDEITEEAMRDKINR